MEEFGRGEIVHGRSTGEASSWDGWVEEKGTERERRCLCEEGMDNCALLTCWKDDANYYFSADMLLFVICGGLIFEALRLVFGFFG
jgi:hypothetical protein